MGGRSREGQTLRSVFSFDLATTTWNRFHTAIFLHLPIYVFFIHSHQRLPDMKEVRWYHGAVVIGELCPFRFYFERWICCPFVSRWEMNLWILYTLRGVFPWAGGRLYAVAGCGQLDSVEYLELESSPVGGQPGPPGQLHLINIIHCNHQYLELNIYSRPIWTAQPIWGRLTMAICLSNGASKAFARGKFDVL